MGRAVGGLGAAFRVQVAWVMGCVIRGVRGRLLGHRLLNYADRCGVVGSRATLMLLPSVVFGAQVAYADEACGCGVGGRLF